MKDKKGQKEEGYMAAIFDSHAHYDAEAFDRDREELLAALPDRGVEGVICAADSLASASRCIALAERYPYIWAAAGIHPENAGTAAKGDMDRLRELCRSDKVVAVGEIGLDYHYEDACPREIQRYWMEKQLALAVELGPTGCCESCIQAELPEKYLQKERREQLRRLEEENGR